MLRTLVVCTLLLTACGHDEPVASPVNVDTTAPLAPVASAAPVATIPDAGAPEEDETQQEFGMIGLLEVDGGNMWGDSIGDAFGAGGLGLSGASGSPGGPQGGVAGGTVGGVQGGIGSSPSPAPTLRQGATTVSGKLPPEVIQRIVRQNFGRFRLCYENGLRTNPKLAGTATIKFTIDASGSVSTAKDGGSTLADSKVVGCVVRGFANLSFPSPEDAKPVSVTYPITFAPGAPAAPTTPPKKK